MIHEIKNFAKNLTEEDFSRNLKLKKGIYIFVDIDQSGRIVNVDFQIYEETESINNFLKRWLFLQVNTKPVSNAKIFNPGKKIFNISCSPFAFGFNNKNTLKEVRNLKDELKKEIDKETELKETYGSKELSTDLKKVLSKIEKIKTNLEKRRKDIEDSVIQYFETAENYVNDGYEQLFFNSFKQCVYRYFLRNENDYTLPFDLRRVLIEAKTDQLILVSPRSIVIDSCASWILTDRSVKNSHEQYLTKKVFNKDKFNVETTEGIYGISDSLNGFNDKKMFLKHHSAPLEFNYRVSGEVAMQLWRFFQLQQNKQIPNPVPIFIDKQELNEKMISIFNSEEKKIGHAEMVKRILRHSDQKDLQNYYLIFFQGTKGSRVADIDFIPIFKYEEKNVKISEVFNLGGSQRNKKIENIFDIEQYIFAKLFDGILIRYGELFYFYQFFDQKDKKAAGIRKELAQKGKLNSLQLFMKYRQSIYDFIYKSRRQAITSVMFDDMMLQGIIDDIRNDDVKEGNHTKEYTIKEKLNIWFSLYDFFTNSTPLIRKNMANRTKEIILQLKELTETDSHLKDGDDESFAFAAGQIIWKLLIQSQSSNRTHALLEPFLQKVDVSQFKLAIARTFEMYKHEFTLYPEKYGFDKIMSEVMGYDPNETNMKKLLPFILAGYFAKSVFSKEQEN